MASESVMLIEDTPNDWQSPHPTAHESPSDTFDRRMTQAEALAHAVVCEDFGSFNHVIQNNVLWLLADTITEARIAAEEMRRAKQ